MTGATDRELLELAAKAAGVCLHPEDKLQRSFGNWGCDTTCIVCKKDPSDSRWNPLTDDGDALRLAVKLNLLIDCASQCARPLPDELGWFGGDGEKDYAAATRRAITLAAAEIGAMSAKKESKACD